MIEETEVTTRRQPSIGIALGILVLAVTIASISYFRVRTGASPTVKSLAVLPLKDLAGGVGRIHLEVGIADSIIGEVSQIPGLTVRPTSAVRKYAESAPDTLQAARDLKVDAILDGTLQVAGDRVRVNFNLLESSSGRSLWTQVFDVAKSEIFEIEDKVAIQVARQLRLRLDAPGQVSAARRSTRNAEAYEHYLKGLYSNEVNRRAVGARPAIEAAITRFGKATELDPSYAEAWAQLAICSNELLLFYGSDQNLAEQVKNAAERAAALAPDLADLHVLRAQSLWSWSGHYQLEEGIRELRRAAGYNSAVVRSLLGVLYSHTGLDSQAEAEMKRAMEIDPANVLYLDRLAVGYIWAGRHDDARAAFSREFALHAESQGSLNMSAIPFLHAREFEEARRRLEKGGDKQNHVAPAYLALLAALRGRFHDAEAAIPSDTAEMEKLRDGHHAFYAFASIFALQGKSAQAVGWLRKTVETGITNYPLFARDENLDRVRSSAEFMRFMAELKPRYEEMKNEFRY